MSTINKLKINKLSHTPLTISYLHWHLNLSLFQRCLLLQTLASNLNMHLHLSCYLVSLVLDIRLNISTFMLFITLITQIFPYGSLILLPLQLHLIVLILKGKNTGSSLITLVISGLALRLGNLIKLLILQ